MERLNRSDRDKIYLLLESGPSLIEASKNIEEMDLDEIFIQKYRIAYVALVMSWFHFDVSHIAIPNISEAFYWKIRMELEDDLENSVLDIEEYFEFMRHMCFSMDGIAEEFLTGVLKKTNWIFLQFFCPLDYEKKLTDEQLQWCKNAIEIFWVTCEQENGKCERCTERLKNIGFEPIQPGDFYPDRGLLLYNPVITEALTKCQIEPKYKLEPEFKEIHKFLSGPLFGRYFPDMHTFNIDTQFYTGYMLGTAFSDSEESCCFYQLNYERVIFYLLAEMAALELLDKIKGDIKSNDGL